MSLPYFKCRRIDLSMRRRHRGTQGRLQTWPLPALAPTLLFFLLVNGLWSTLGEPNFAFVHAQRPFSYLSTSDITNHDFVDGFVSQPYGNRYKSTAQSADFFHGSAASSLADTDLYSGPVFTVEPEQSDRTPLCFSNVTSVPLTCKVAGYPTPQVEWRVNNISLTFSRSDHDEHRNQQPQHHEEHHRQQLYSPQLNAIVTLRNDGQTLLIGGAVNGGAYQQPPSAHHHSFSNVALNSAVHQIECLARNQFGAIISRPVYVQQGRFDLLSSQEMRCLP